MVIFKGDFACLQAINLTAFTTGDLVFIYGWKKVFARTVVSLTYGYLMEHPTGYSRTIIVNVEGFVEVQMWLMMLTWTKNFYI